MPGLILKCNLHVACHKLNVDKNIKQKKTKNIANCDNSSKTNLLQNLKAISCWIHQKSTIPIANFNHNDVSKIEWKIKDVHQLHKLKLACLKDCYPLSRIDALVGLKYWCFYHDLLDEFFKYYQIKIQLINCVKILFKIKDDLYYYNVMSLDLKYIGEIY